MDLTERLRRAVDKTLAPPPFSSMNSMPLRFQGIVAPLRVLRTRLMRSDLAHGYEVNLRFVGG